MDNLLLLKKTLKSYNDEKVILDELSLKIQTEQVVFLVGPNGAGKTTLVKIILGLLSTDQGEIIYKGKKISQPYDNTIKKQLGYLPDDPIFIEYLTAMENLNYYCAIYKKDWTSPQLYELLQSHELDKTNKKLVKDFSRGMRQKLSLCLLDIVNPELVIMDEPTIGLDIIGIEYLKRYIQTLKKKKKGLLITTHDMAFCKSTADKVYLLNKGKAKLLDEDEEKMDMISQIEKNIINHL